MTTGTLILIAGAAVLVAAVTLTLVFCLGSKRSKEKLNYYLRQRY